jgi:hypothetical protein
MDAHAQMKRERRCQTEKEGELVESLTLNNSERRATQSPKDDQTVSCVPLPTINSSVMEEVLNEQECPLLQGGKTPDMLQQISVPLLRVQIDPSYPSAHASAQLPSIEIGAEQRTLLPILLVGMPEIRAALPRGEDHIRSTLEMDGERTGRVARRSHGVKPLHHVATSRDYITLQHAFFKPGLAAAGSTPTCSRYRHNREMQSPKDNQTDSCIPLLANNSSMIEEVLSEQECSLPQGGKTLDMLQQHSAPLLRVQIDSRHPSAHDSAQLPPIEVGAAKRTLLPTLLVGMPEIHDALPRGADHNRSILEMYRERTDHNRSILAMYRERTSRLARTPLGVEPSHWDGYGTLQHSFVIPVLAAASSTPAAQIQSAGSRHHHSMPVGIPLQHSSFIPGPAAASSAPAAQIQPALSRRRHSMLVSNPLQHSSFIPGPAAPSSTPAAQIQPALSRHRHSMPVGIMLQHSSFIPGPAAASSTPAAQIQSALSRRSHSMPVGIPLQHSSFIPGPAAPSSTPAAQIQPAFSRHRHSMPVGIMLQHSSFIPGPAAPSSAPAAQIQPPGSRHRHSMPVGIPLQHSSFIPGPAAASSAIAAHIQYARSRHRHSRSHGETLRRHNALKDGEVTSMPDLHVAAPVTGVTGTAMSGASPLTPVRPSAPSSVSRSRFFPHVTRFVEYRSSHGSTIDTRNSPGGRIIFE